MGLRPLSEHSQQSAPRARCEDQRGIALFMVLAAVSVLSILVTEFTYLAQMNQKLAFDGVDQVKAHYLAKSAFKLSLLRLKAYQTVKDTVASMGGAGMVPQSMLDKIWSFPFMYPIPTSLPGISVADKDSIEKFQKESGLEGSYTALIESGSTAFNVNQILPGFQPSPGPSSTPSGQPSAAPSAPAAGASGSPTPYNAEEARKSLSDYLLSLYNNKVTDDENFANDHRDFKIDDFMDGLVSWADPSYERKLTQNRDAFPSKHAPFFSMTEFHMLPGMDDDLYSVFAPALTASQSQGINLNTMSAVLVRALFPGMTPQEASDFISYRDDPETDNSFKSADDFYKYLSTSVAAYKNGAGGLDQIKQDLAKRNIQFTVDETLFKITIQATVNNSTQKIEAWVTLYKPKKTGTPATPGAPAPAAPNGQPNTGVPGQDTPDTGLKVTYMRFS